MSFLNAFVLEIREIQGWGGKQSLDKIGESGQERGQGGIWLSSWHTQRVAGESLMKGRLCSILGCQSYCHQENKLSGSPKKSAKKAATYHLMKTIMTCLAYCCCYYYFLIVGSG